MNKYNEKEIRAFLKDWANNTKRKIKNRILAVDAIDTGRLLDSIDWNMDFDGDEAKITFEMVEYGKFVDEGTVYISPRKFFNDIIEKETDVLEDILEEEIILAIEKRLLEI